MQNIAGVEVTAIVAPTIVADDNVPVEPAAAALGAGTPPFRTKAPPWPGAAAGTALPGKPQVADNVAADVTGAGAADSADQIDRLMG